MQNSGEGNAVNPLASLMDKEVYDMPLLLVIGWRGRPGVHDEPQHVKQGKITTGLLNVMGINYDVLSKEEEKAKTQIDKAVAALRRNEVYALVVEKDTFDSYALQNKVADHYEMSREEAIWKVAASIPNDAVIVSTTGMISRELFEYRTAMGQGHERDFLTVGSMGHSSSIALGIALQKPEKQIWCIDGDGAALMHMGAMAVIGSTHPQNFIHVIIDNNAHESVGGMPTAAKNIDFAQIAKGCGYDHICTVTTMDELKESLNMLTPETGLRLLIAKSTIGARKDLGRPTTTPKRNKTDFMTNLKD
jgi:phosphonopyruvate decarboxylase